jgi:hypothetical protein
VEVIEMKRRASVAASVALILLVVGPGASAAPATAEAGKILIYGPTLNGAPQNEQTIAEAVGYTVTVADTATWSAMTTADFESYNAIVFGDPTCGMDESILSAAVANRTTWSPAVTGNVVVLGSDPIYHQGVGNTVKLIRNAINFAGKGASTGLYVSLSCYYESAPPNTPVEILSEFGTFEVQGACDDVVGITDRGRHHPVLRGIDREGLAHWSCSIHENFNTYPSNFGSLAIDFPVHLSYLIATAHHG